ncbi:unnamed protein product [Diplocarpon coronariae]|uniref:Uncharacterized protein n=1 Tax=Diplocarpon coronariae TaxID=2795749 RepID=A0A218Z2B5_9HELO|nr:hypothetical protein B2J93_3599 [Marssonina coronariae]
MVMDDLLSNISSGRGLKAIARKIRSITKSDILEHVNCGTCLETKYNTTNALLDAGDIALKQSRSKYDREASEVMEAAALDLLDVGKMLDGADNSRINSELCQEPELQQPTFLGDFLEHIDDD